ncbi:MAG: cellulose synthase subunit BcsC-related outer membrane protein [Deltaproteobacteria bacterium]
MTRPLKIAIAVILMLLSFNAAPAVYAEEVQPDAQIEKPLNSWDEWALSELAWQHYKGGFYNDALKEFSRLVRQNQGNGDYHLGMAYTLMKLERLDEALKIAEEHEAEKKDFSTIKAAIYQKKGNEAYDKKLYAEALEYFKKAISAKPSDTGAQAMYGWSLYNQGRLDEALPRLVEMYKNDNDPGIAEIIVLIHQRNNDTSNASLFAASLAESKNKNLNKVAADYYFSEGYPVKASLTYRHPKTCYFNANNPELDISASVRYKTGQKGASRLREESLTAAYILPLAPANEMTFSMAAKELSSGAAPEGLFAGSHYKSIPLKNGIPQSIQVIEPRLSYKGADKTPYRLEAGTTPIGASITPLPVFNAEVMIGSLRLNAHQESVKESVLSYVGLKDPYGDTHWGRVVRSGVEAEYKLRPYEDYWLSLKAGYDYYWGEFVMPNSSLSATAAVGRTFHPASNAFSAGFFATGKQFKNNSNFYTYGHGGYFSPARFMAAGPMIRFETTQCKDYYADIQAAVSYLKYTTENVKQYPFETSGLQSGYHYNGEGFTGIGYSVDGRAVRLITGYWAAEASFKLNKSADYREWTALASINYYFEPRNAVVARR